MLARSPELVDLVQPTLELAGYEVRTVPTGAAALAHMGRAPYDLLIVDTTLPDLPEIPRRRRGGNDGTPVLFLATGEYLETILPEVGVSGEDYVTRPLRIPDLLARVWLLVRRRREGAAELVLRHGDVVVDDVTCRAWRGDRELDLTPAEYRMLCHLLRNPGKVLSKENIARHIWGEYPGDNAIERLVSRLRGKVDRQGPSLIRTHRGFGYALGDLLR